MWWTWLACGDDDGPRDRDRPAETAETAHSGAPVLTVGPADPVWGRDDLTCAASDGAPVTWTVDGRPFDAVGGRVPAPDVREGRAWTCAAAGATPVTLTPRVAGGDVLIIVLDDIGRDRLASFGGTASTALTPAIDALRARSVVFDHAWATPVCSSTRAALLTGRRPHRTGVGDLVNPEDDWSLPPTEVTVGAALAAAPEPWDTAFVGKWHLSTRAAGPAYPLGFGFASFSGSMANIDARFQGTLPPQPLLPVGYFQFEWNDGGALAWVQGYATDRAVDDARRALRAAGHPSLTVVALNAAHKPWHVPPPVWRRSPLGPPWTDDHTLDWMVESADLAVEALVAAAGPDATIVLLADNGTVDDVLLAPYDAAALPFGKGSVHEAGVNVPFLVAGPLVTVPGVSRALVEVTDVFDTVLAIAGLTDDDVDDALGPVDRDSVSLLPYLADPARPSLRPTAVTDRFLPNGPGEDRTLHYRAARDARFKLVRYELTGAPSFEALYDLGDDLVEGEDLLRRPLAADAAAAYAALDAVLAADTDPGTTR